MGDQTDQSDQSDQNDYKPWCLPGDPVDSSILSPTWEKLQELEEKRREILGRAELPFWRILLSWNGTCLRALFLDWLIWLPIGIFVTVRILARKYELVDILENTKIDIIGGFLSFFLVYFVNQANTRFFNMYKLAKECSDKMIEVTGTAVTKFTPGAASRLVRYMNAGHVVGYAGLDGPYTRENFFEHLNQDYKLLTKEEIDVLDRREWSHLEVFSWCFHDLKKSKAKGMIDSKESREINRQLLTMQAAMIDIFDYVEQPPHFFYIHFLCLLSALYLPLFALENALSVGSDDHWSVEVTTAIIVVLQSAFVIGLRLVGQKMVDPFGDDLEDLSVLSYIVITIQECRLILSTGTSPIMNEHVEGKLAKNSHIKNIISIY